MERDGTKERFGYQWTKFDHVIPEFEKHFQRLIHPLTSADFAGKLVLDAGCGYGRYSLCAAKFGAQVIGMDFSRAIYAAKAVAQGANMPLLSGNILTPPFREAAFDIVMSIGVLHHLPDPFEGFQKLARLVKPGGLALIWLYSAQRRLSNFFLESLRKAVRPFSNNLLYALAFTLAVPDFVLASSLRMIARRRLRNLVPTHFRLYGQFPFCISWADWFDRLGAPIRHYYTKQELEGWLGLIDAEGDVYPTEDFGWTIVARVGVDRRGAHLDGNGRRR